ncbi:UNVERIFIED_CONTAM: hypothetical protein GTU68_012387, partial [Idotea baltica]|nr:hypothetical protein [Idotea baltica]
MSGINDTSNSHSITLVVTGSIAAYKSAELLRGLSKSGFHVRVAMTASATEFISPLTLQTLSGELVSTELFDLTSESEIGHIGLADEADLVLVAPATGNFIAKAALGLADDLASTILLAATCPLVVAPALNVNMWNHAATRANVDVLKGRGCHFVEPEEGELACGWQGA